MWLRTLGENDFHGVDAVGRVEGAGRRRKPPGTPPQSSLNPVRAWLIADACLNRQLPSTGCAISPGSHKLMTWRYVARPEGDRGERRCQGSRGVDGSCCAVGNSVILLRVLTAKGLRR